MRGQGLRHEQAGPVALLLCGKIIVKMKTGVPDGHEEAWLIRHTSSALSDPDTNLGVCKRLLRGQSSTEGTRKTYVYDRARC